MDGADRSRVDFLGLDDVDEVVSVLSDAFYDYPVMRFVLGSEGDYDSRLRQLVTFFVQARVVRDEPLLGVRRSGGLTAAALVSYPGSGRRSPEMAPLHERTWRVLGAEARARYEAFSEASADFEVHTPHIHLNMIGVRGAAQGLGLGRALLEAVHDLSSTDLRSMGVSLTTEVESNVVLYEHFGYELVGRASVESAFTTWGLYRSDE